MFHDPQSPSEEDPRAQSRRHLHTRKEAIELAQSVADAHDREWAVMFYLDAHHDLLHTHDPIFLRQCPAVVDPQDYFTLGHALGATSLIGVRYHPHAWASFTHEWIQGYEVWQEASRLAGIGLLDTIHVDPQGMRFSCRGRDWYAHAKRVFAP
jgi:DNA repair protein RadC